MFHKPLPLFLQPCVERVIKTKALLPVEYHQAAKADVGRWEDGGLARKGLLYQRGMG